MRKDNFFKLPSSKIFLVISLCLFFAFSISLQQLKAQDEPYVRLKKAAQKSPVIQNELPAVTLTTASPVWKANSRTPIPFIPFDMVDQFGRKIDPAETATLQNGKTVTAEEFFKDLNYMEQKLNAQGYSFRQSNNLVASSIVTPASTLSGSNLPRQINSLEKGQNFSGFISPVKKVGNVVLKPMFAYTPAEKQKVNQLNFSGTAGKIVIKGAYRPVLNALFISKSPQKIINDTSKYTWSKGSSSTFQAAIQGQLIRHAVLYQYDPQNQYKNLSEFGVIADGEISGSLLGYSIDLLSANANFFAPEDTSKDMTANFVITLAGLSILNKNYSLPQYKTFYDTLISRSIDKSFAINVPIVYGINFTGTIGVKGTVGLSYSGSIGRTLAYLKAEPVAELSGYATAGLAIGIDGVDVGEAGVGGDLTFVKGNLDLESLIGLWNQNETQLVFAYNYYFGYDLNMLSGDLYGYVNAFCAWGYCIYRSPHHVFFSWPGYKSSGTILEGDKSTVIYTSTTKPTLSVKTR